MRAAETILPNVSERHVQLNSGNMFIAHAPDEFRLRHASRSKARQLNRCQIWNLAYDRLDDLHQDGFRKFRDQMIKEGPNRRQQSLPVRNERRNRGVAGDPVRQYPPQGSGFDRSAADVTGQRRESRDL